MKFRYQAKTREGEQQVGFVEAPDRDSAVSILTGHNLFILSLEPAEKIRWYDAWANYFTRVRRKDLVIFTRALSSLMQARIPLNNLLTILYEQTSQPTLKEAIHQLLEDVDSGLSFSQAVEHQPAVFPPLFVSIIRAAEVVGNLENATAFLADYMEKEDNLIKKTLSAMLYPGVIIILFIIVSFIIISFVLPQIGPVFTQAGVALPLFTVLLIAVGSFINNWWLLVLVGLAFLIILVTNYFETLEGRAFKDDLKIRLPLIRKIYLSSTISRISNTVSTLLRGGVPVVQALEISGESIDNIIYREILHEIADNVRQGKNLSESLIQYPDYFPELVSQIIAVGEKTGQIDQSFLRLANFYNAQSDAAINNMVDLIQPTLIIAIGILVGLLFASVLLPIYQLIGKF